MNFIPQRIRGVSIPWRAVWWVFFLASFQEGRAQTNALNIPAAEFNALGDFYANTGGAAWLTNSGWLSAQATSWFGVTVVSNHVVGLDLTSNNLSGNIPASIGTLSALESLLLSTNFITGSIPSSVSNLMALTNISVASNELNGSIPAGVCNLAQLQSLHLCGNQISGGIPTNLGNLARLQHLNLRNNNLTGSIPTSVSNLGQLQYLDISHNQLDGGIPPAMGSLTNLVYLNLFANRIFGGIPTNLGNLELLQSAYLGSNLLTGSIPAGLGELPSLTNLGLEHNQLSGSLPANLGGLTQLRQFNCLDNFFSGTIPEGISNLVLLQSALFGSNQLRGSIPAGFGSLVALTNLGLDHNLFSGPIPTNWGGLILLQELHGEGNALTGGIPANLGGLAQLRTLNLFGNELTGSVPGSFGGLTNLSSLNLGSNDLSGGLPDGLGDLMLLENLDLTGNQFDGAIPSSLGSLPLLTNLDLSENQLSGHIPAALTNLSRLQGLWLFDNQFIGDMPNFAALTRATINIRFNYLTIASDSTSLSNIDAMIAATNAVTYSPQNGSFLSGSLQVNLTPASAVSAGAQWQFDGGTFLNIEGTVTGLAVGSHLISFGPVPGFVPPPDQLVTINNNETTSVTGYYKAVAAPTNGLILVTNGAGIIEHGTWPHTLVVGKKYTVKALPKLKNAFVSWVGGVGPPYSVLSTNISYTFTMQPNLLLEAKFVTNLFADAAGSYNGLFAPVDADRNQTNSGSIAFTLSAVGAVSGRLHIGAQAVSLTGKFNSAGSALLVSVQGGKTTLTTTLQLDLADQTVTGTVSDGNFTAQVLGFQGVFSSRQPADAYKGRYTLTMPGSTNPAVGPGGASYASVVVGATGAVTFGGSLSDGTAVSETTTVSKEGYWPVYVSIYGGKGSVWSWNYFTNGAVASVPYGSWINGSQSSKLSLYRQGFTNEALTFAGTNYVSSNSPLLALTNGEVILQGGGLPFPITNEITLTSTGRISLTNAIDTNELTLTITKTSGVITGSFRNPAKTSQKLNIYGVLRQDQTNAQGYFLGTNQSGTFLLIPQ